VPVPKKLKNRVVLPGLTGEGDREWDDGAVGLDHVDISVLDNSPGDRDLPAKKYLDCGLLALSPSVSGGVE
jgi:hypothetical protein